MSPKTKKRLKIAAAIGVVVVVIIIIAAATAKTPSGGGSAPSSGGGSAPSSGGGSAPSSGGGSSPSSGGGSSPSLWDPIKAAWPTAAGSVLSTVIGKDAGSASVAWVTDNAENVHGTMTQNSANTVCNKACTGWSSVPQVGTYCDCSDNTAINF